MADDLAAALVAMESAYRRGDAITLGRAAHTAKGLARGLGDSEPEFLAEGIEAACRDGSLAGVDERLARFAAILSGIRGAALR